MANSEKKAAAKSAGATPGGQDPSAASNTKWIIIGAVAIVALVGSALYWRSSESSSAGPVRGEKKDVSVAVLMAPGPLEDIALGQADAPYTIVEYASLTCGHCARFHTNILPELKERYIDTGKARLILREFPLDGLATAAFMLARCSGNDRYYPMVDALFETQQNWAVQGGDGKEKLFSIARQAGFSREKFDQCLADQELFDKIVQSRKIALEKFGVDSTPAFFVNGKRLQGDHKLADFQPLLGEEPDSEPEGTAPQ